jgi:8-oxo-dGTP pyrophosphatase MutT (NUDIX family)
MVDLQKFNAKVCLTASGTLIHQGKILLIKHKKLGIWLTPGGHIEPGEMPHQTAVREFWEETGIKVRAKHHGFFMESDQSEFTSVPLSCNLHWVSQDNYEHRVHGKSLTAAAKKKWSRGCEQHLDMRFLMEPIDGVEFQQNVEETDGIAWFRPDEIDQLETAATVKAEIQQAFLLAVINF